MTALEKFNPTRGVSLATCAMYWIRQGITREIANHSEVGRVPCHQQEKPRKAGAPVGGARDKPGRTVARTADGGRQLKLHDLLGVDGGQLESAERAETEGGGVAPARAGTAHTHPMQRRSHAEIAPEGVTSERVRQVESAAMAVVRQRLAG